MAEALPTYINSSFLYTYLNKETIGLVYTAASLLALFVLSQTTKLLKRFGNTKLYFTLISLHAIGLLILAVRPMAAVALAVFCIGLVAVRLRNFSHDIFLERYSDDEETGGIRGAFLTIVNLAWLVSPLITGELIGDTEAYWRVFIACAASLVPVACIAFFKLRKFKDPEYETVPFKETLGFIKNNKDLRINFFVQIILSFFYSWMVVYTPLYLHEVIGFEWNTLGIIFTVMLLPFVLLDTPLGWLADKKLGEKEIMVVGFFIAAIAVGSLAFVTTPAVWVWAGLLFMTRAGAAMIELSSEAFFFKHIDGKRSALVSTFRMTSPLAYVIGPLVASVFLSFFEFNMLFPVLGLITLSGVFLALRLKDTR